MIRCGCMRFLQKPVPDCFIPLVSVRFHAIVHNSLATLTVLQEFVNAESKPIECEYTFPIVQDSVVTGLKIYLPDGTVLNSKIEEEEKAQEMYQDALSEGNTAIMSKLETQDKMTVIIGNIGPSQSIKTEFTMVFPLASDSCDWKLPLPSGFIPSENKNTFNLDIIAEILSRSAISSYSSNYPLVWEVSPDSLYAKGVLNTQVPSSNEPTIWIKYRSGVTNTPSCIIQRIGNKYACMLSFIPFCDDIDSIEEVEGTGEYLFVLDRSGSMRGERINLAKKAAILFLKSLPSGSLFNIISFGTSFDMLYKSSKLNTSSVIDSAIQKIESFDADMGGTNIYNPLEAIFRNSPSNEYPRTIFLLTDGQVEDPDRVISLIEQHSHNTKVHGFGIGNDVDPYLINKSSKAGRGSSNFISDTEELGKIVIRALRKAILPCLNTWGISLKGESYPSAENLGCINYSERFVQYIMLNGMPESSITISCFDNFKKSVIDYSINSFETIPGDQILKLWGKNKIDFLSKSFSENRDSIIEISKELGIPSKATAFICIKENSEAVTGDIKSVKIPIKNNRISIRKDSSGTGLGQRNRVPISARKMALGMESKKSELLKKKSTGLVQKEKSSPHEFVMSSLNSDLAMSFKSSAPKEKIKRSEPVEELKKNTESKLRVSQVKKKSEKKVLNIAEYCEMEEEKKSNYNPNNLVKTQGDPNLFMSLIKAQKTEGFWNFSDLIKLLPRVQGIPRDLIEIPDKETVYSTLYAICYLQQYHAENYEEWILVEKKAIKWLKSRQVNFKDHQAAFSRYL
jgi:von Willebrand factor type A domain/Vault protein inter-alpha-trypsin domain